MKNVFAVILVAVVMTAVLFGAECRFEQARADSFALRAEEMSFPEQLLGQSGYIY